MHNINKQLEPLAHPITFFKNDPNNARLHPEPSVQAIVTSLSEYGQQKPVVCLEDGTVIAGNGMLSAAQRLGWGKLAAVVFSDAEKARAYAIADNRTAEHSQWDPEQLAKSLKEIAARGITLDKVGFDDESLKRVVVEGYERQTLAGGSEPAANESRKYTTKITLPIYEPKNEKPGVDSLLDTSKTDALVREIEHSDLPGDVAVFLKHAAQRHTVFKFRRIADFYAHSGPDIQNLFEKSALVIIDFNKAIENGFTNLSQRIDHLISVEGSAEGQEDA